MKATAIRLDLLHELLLLKPVFSLARSTPDILKVFYETISPRFPIATENMSVTASNVLSDLHVRIGLFANTVSLELRPQKMTLLATNIRERASVSVLKDLLSLSHEGFEKAFEEKPAGNSRFLLHLWLAVEGGVEAARAAIGRSAVPHLTIKPSSIGAETISYSVRAQLQNKKDGWEITVAEEPSIISDAHVFLVIDSRFGSSTKYSRLADQVSFIEDTSPKLLASLGLELDNTSSSGAG